MCGIVGCICKKPGQCLSAIINGINHMPQRGTESFGIGTVNPQELIYHKKANLDTKTFNDTLGEDLSKYQNIMIGIAHCRAASQGANTDQNAHPHADQSNRFLLVHNGNIDNFQEIKKRLIDLGFAFRSETDSEVIVNLISFYAQQSQADESSDNSKYVADAIRKTVKDLKGAWACLLLTTYTPNIIWAFRNSCPLVLGFHSLNADGKSDFLIIASEESAFNCDVNGQHILEENQIYSLQNLGLFHNCDNVGGT